MNQNAVAIKCYHCGDDCLNEPLVFAEKNFCCDGCRLVYELLEENNLCSYYSLEKQAGNKVSTPANGRFSFLDDETVAKQLLRFQDEKISIVQLTIPKMHCSSCIYLLERLHQLNNGILKSEVNFLKKEVIITFEKNKASLRQVFELLVRIGYEPELNLDSFEGKQTKRLSRKLINQIGITGFCFGNIMMLSFSEYLAGKGNVDPMLAKVFSFLNLVIAIPVIAYGAQDYFINAWKGVRDKYFNIDFPIALGILAMFIRSSYEIISQTGVGYFDSMAGLVFFLLLGKYFQNKTYDTLSFERDYKAYFPMAVQLKVRGAEQSVAVSQLKSGDNIIIHNEEIIPADATLQSAHASIDYSFVTGESVPVLKRKGDTIYAGGRQKGSAIELEVLKTVSQSYLTRLWNNDAFQKKKAESISKLADSISKYFTIVILVIATATFVYWYPRNISIAIQAATSILIIACPCALAITVPFTLGNVSRYLGRVGFYVKNTAVIETLSKCNTLVFDKTGTLTLQDESEVNFIGDELTDQQINLIASVAYQSAHPLSRKIYEQLKFVNRSRVFDFTEIPGRGIEGTVTGKKIKLGSAEFVGVERRETINQQTVFVKIDDTVFGYFSFKQVYRNGFEKMMKSLRKSFSLFLLSGDNDGEKKSLANQFQQTEMQFNQSPESKLNFIKQLQTQNKKVVMIGDGLNDAGALQQAEVGISVTDKITQFTPASDVIMDGKIFNQLHPVLNYVKSGMKIIRIIFIVSLLYNVIGISFAVQGKLSPMVAAILMPVSALTVISLSYILTKWYAKNMQPQTTHDKSQSVN